MSLLKVRRSNVCLLIPVEPVGGKFHRAVSFLIKPCLNSDFVGFLELVDEVFIVANKNVGCAVVIWACGRKSLWIAITKSH